MVLSDPMQTVEQIVSAIPNRVAVLDQKGNMVIVNKAWKEFNWRSSNLPSNYDWVGLNFFDAFPDKTDKNNLYVAKIKKAINSIISGAQSHFQIEYPYHTESDTEWYAVNIQSTNTKDGLVVLTHSDNIRNKLSESGTEEFGLHDARFMGAEASVATLWADQLNQDLNKIVEESLNEIFIFDAESLRFLQVNRGGRTNLGYTLSELLQMTPLDIKPEFTEAMFMELINPLLTGEREKIIFETVHQRKNGTEYPVEIHLQVSTLLGEAVFVAIILDITESKRVKQDLQDLNDHLEDLVQDRTSRLRVNESKLHKANELAKVGYWELDLYSKHSTWSEGFFKLYDFDEIDVINDSRYFLQFVHEEDKEHVVRLSKAAIDNEEDIQFEYRIITHKGNLKYIRARIHFLVDKYGNSNKLFSAIQDITEQKQSELELEKMLRVEKDMNQMKSRFVSMASHEFRTPLSTILSSVSLISRYQKSEEQDKRDKHINRIKSGVQNLTSILNDFLSLEKLESNKIEKTEKLIDFGAFIREIHEDAKLLMNGDQKLNIELDPIKEIQIDPHLLRNILFNLLSNAIKYSPKHTDVDLACHISNGNLNLMVRDYGIGIPESEQEKLFTRFFRASNAETINGTGLGLIIVKRYLDLLDGEISFDSTQGKGTTFNVVVPVS